MEGDIKEDSPFNKGYFVNNKVFDEYDTFEEKYDKLMKWSRHNYLLDYWSWGMV